MTRVGKNPSRYELGAIFVMGENQRASALDHIGGRKSCRWVAPTKVGSAPHPLLGGAAMRGLVAW